ncbi:MAG: TetR/AcrR family transcriptional regulator [Clostridiales Family XIII bacterium]|jgi:TetR/AcrR family fatty acid metabolism transcriptional regulator|nr:TetR/AcrR family transcriptional regulator [Clostridiales Family XIII bacterium]
MKEAKELRKERILDAAFQIFLENGYARAKMSDIAARAGFGKSTLYEYFASKEEIFEQLLRYKFVNQYLALGETAERAVDDQGNNSASAKLYTFLSNEIDLLIAYSTMDELMPSAMMNPEFRTSPILGKVVKSVLRYKFEHLSGWIGDGLESGEFHGVSPNVAAVSVIGAVSTFSTALTKLFLCGERSGKKGEPPEEIISEILRTSESADSLAEAKEDFFRFIFAGLGKK